MCIQNLYSQVYVRKRRYVTAMYINRNRIRKIIDRGNSLSPSARSCAPPRAEIFLYIFPSPPYFRWWPPIRNHIDRIKQYLDWREYLRAGFASGHGPASGSRRVLEEIRRTVAWEREREDRSSAGGRETARRGEVRARQRGKGTDGTARTQPIRTMAVWNQWRVCSAATQFTKFFLHVVGSYLDSVFPPTPRILCVCRNASRKEAEAPLSLLLAFPISFSRAFILFRANPTRNVTFFFFFYYRGNLRENWGGGERRGGLDNFFSFPHLDLN